MVASARAAGALLRPGHFGPVVLNLIKIESRLIQCVCWCFFESQFVTSVHHEARNFFKFVLFR